MTASAGHADFGAATSTTETSGLLGHSEQVSASGVCRLRRVTLGGVALAGGAAALLAWRALGGPSCAHHGVRVAAPPASIVELVATNPDELLSLGDHVDQEAVVDWVRARSLEEAAAASDPAKLPAVLEKVKAAIAKAAEPTAAGVPATAPTVAVAPAKSLAVLEELKAAVAKAVDATAPGDPATAPTAAGDPEKTPAVLDKLKAAVAKAAEATAAGDPATASAAPEPVKTVAEKVVEHAKDKAAGRWRDSRSGLVDFLRGSRREGLRGGAKTPSQQASIASCTFDTLQATTQLAALATSINDAAKTCHGKDPICVINAEQIIASIAAMAASLSVAANNCADSALVKNPNFPNIPALCAGSISGLIQSLAELSIGASLTAVACDPKLNNLMPEGVTPATIGQQAGAAAAPPPRRLGEGNASAEARRLLFGGGKDATSTFCAVDVASASWYLAQAGIAINAAANPDAGAVCPPRSVFGGTAVKGEAFQQSQGFCSVSITGAIFGFLEAIKYIEMAFVQCTDTWNFPALCGAGITGLLASFDGIAFSGSSMYLACDKLLNHDPKVPLFAPTRDALLNNALGNSGDFGRRLSVDGTADEGSAALRRKFASPQEAWKSIGFDVSSPGSPLRKLELAQGSPERFLELVSEEEEPQPMNIHSIKSSLFGAQGVCQ